MSIETVLRFAELGLAAPILQAIDEIGYETPSPIQAQSIPVLMGGRDLIGQAQTGTGKTAAFALPIASKVATRARATQALILTPTRELAIQVAEAIHAYARHLDGLHVVPIYGGQHIGVQLRHLRRGAHIVVGTPGRVIDHLDRGTLVLDDVQTVVLDEADEMLRMGFIEDVDRILQATPEHRQVALFSATMPEPVRRIAERHLNDPEEITIEAETATVETIEQHYIVAPWRQKLDAMTRILETTDYSAMLIFVRTKVATVELSERLEARGHACAALNGDMTQAMRERTVQRLRDGKLDIVVATDVAARGLDVSRISHVVNYDIPTDTEAYVHRIGRTGRAGREGRALLLVQPREKRMLRAIERATGQLISPMQVPSPADVTERRIARFKQTVHETIESNDLAFFDRILEALAAEQGHTPEKIASALAFLVQRDRPLQALGDPGEGMGESTSREERRESRGGARPSGERGGQDGFTSYRIDVGYRQGTQPKHIVGAITNEAGLEGSDVGRIDIREKYSVVDLPRTLSKSVIEKLRVVEIFGHPLRARAVEAGEDTRDDGGPPRGRFAKPSKGGKDAKRFGKNGKGEKRFSKGGKGFTKGEKRFSKNANGEKRYSRDGDGEERPAKGGKGGKSFAKGGKSFSKGGKSFGKGGKSFAKGGKSFAKGKKGGKPKGHKVK